MFLYNILEELLTPIREKRHYYEQRIEEVLKTLQQGTEEANKYANNTLKEVKNAIGIDYFDNDSFIKEQSKKYE